MKYSSFNHASVCRQVVQILPDYMDNSLSARQVWEIEKHLAVCTECADMCHEMQSTVQLLRAVPRFDTGDNFMASLHARLDGLEPEPLRSRSALQQLRDWAADGGAALVRNRLPVLGLGMASAALWALFIVNRPLAPDVTKSSTGTVSENWLRRENVHISVAASANSAFSDPAAVNLEDRSASTDFDKAQATF